MYVSVPFCRAKCSFCNFASGVSGPERVAAYVSRLCAEIEAAGERAAGLGAELPGVVDSVYFGGGTPSLLESSQLEAIFEALRRRFAVRTDAEITMEAAPGQISDEVLETALGLGVNRVSLGVQSFVDREAQAVGRTHTGESCLREIARLRAAGIAEVGADLIAGLPYQTAASWQVSLDAAAGAGAEDTTGLTHLSVYLLEIDEGSRLGREVLGGGARLHAPAVASEELAAELYQQACEFLGNRGFGQYEISNFARRSEAGGLHESRHNRKYWERAPYLGFGLDAHSMLVRGDGSAVRFANAKDLARYEDGVVGEVAEVSERDAFEECVFLGLRMNEGLRVSGLRERFAEEWVREVEAQVAELVRAGLMWSSHGRWGLTLRGSLVSSEVFGELLAVAV